MGETLDRSFLSGETPGQEHVQNMTSSLSAKRMLASCTIQSMFVTAFMCLASMLLLGKMFQYRGDHHVLVLSDVARFVCFGS